MHGQEHVLGMLSFRWTESILVKRCHLLSQLLILCHLRHQACLFLLRGLFFCLLQVNEM